MACFKGILLYIYAYICIDLLYLYILFIFAHQFLLQPRDSTFFQGCLWNPSFLGRKQTKSPNWNHSCFGSALGQVSYTFGFLALPLPVGVDRLGPTWQTPKTRKSTPVIFTEIFPHFSGPQGKCYISEPTNKGSTTNCWSRDLVLRPSGSPSLSRW